MIKILSLGWGTQSFTLAAMVAIGELEPVDHVIFVDSGHEKSGTYEFIKVNEPWLNEKGVSVTTIKTGDGSIFKNLEKNPNKTRAPFFTLSEKGKKGKLLRQCTDYWKIRPKRKWFREVIPKGNIEQWLGFTTDERHRILRQHELKRVTNRYPLIEKGMSRDDCGVWLKDHGFDIPPRSCCFFCPMHDLKEWREVKANKKDWESSIKLDRHIRNLRSPWRLYVHSSCYPLEDVDLRTQEEKGQLRLL